jgi:hypothetical protein
MFADVHRWPWRLSLTLSLSRLQADRQWLLSSRALTDRPDATGTWSVSAVAHDGRYLDTLALVATP